MENKETKEIGFVLLSGAGLGAWIWKDLTAQLEHPALAVDYPGRGIYADMAVKGLGLNQYVASVISDLDRFPPRKVVIVAHSIGGVIGIEVTHQRRKRIAGFVAVSAAIPAVHGSYASTLPVFSRVFLRIMMSLAGTRPPDSVIRKALCEDLDADRAREVSERFIPESKRLYLDKTTAPAPPDHALYIRLKKDRALRHPLQSRMLLNLPAAQVIDLDSGHLPMVSKPIELGELLNHFAATINN